MPPLAALAPLAIGLATTAAGAGISSAMTPSSHSEVGGQLDSMLGGNQDQELAQGTQQMLQSQSDGGHSDSLMAGLMQPKPGAAAPPTQQHPDIAIPATPDAAPGAAMPIGASPTTTGAAGATPTTGGVNLSGDLANAGVGVAGNLLSSALNSRSSHSTQGGAMPGSAQDDTLSLLNLAGGRKGQNALFSGLGLA